MNRISIHNLTRTAVSALLLPALAPSLTSCINDDDDNTSYSIPVALMNHWPEGMDDDTVIESAEINFKELNTGIVYSLNPIGDDLNTLPLGVYDYEGTIKIAISSADGNVTTKTMRVSGTSVTISSPTQLRLNWFFTNPGGTLVFSEIYATGSPNATATGGIRDTYIRICNNSDETVYADGIGIAESAFVNSRTNSFEILTPENDRQTNFTAATIWVIPGSGKDVPIAPGESIKIVDQGIDWTAQVAGAQNHTDAAFEWYDDNAQDTDSPSVPNLTKWYCYSNTIWIIANQCNRSYALVKFPDDMTAENYLTQYHGGYDYISAIGSHMHNDHAYLIPNEWILDGVNLGNDESYVYGALGSAIDISYASISDINSDPNRFGRAFRRKIATVADDGTVVLQDTNDSAADFQTVYINK